MGSFADYAENKIVDHILGTAFTAPTIYIGLSTTDPLDDASGISEPSGNNYGRKAHATWNTAASRANTNDGAVVFNQASGPWGTIAYYFICDHSTNTGWGSNVNLIAHGSLATSKSVVSGNTPSIADEEISVSITAGAFSTYLVNKILDHVFGVASYSSPTIAIGLSTTTPADGGTNITEPSGNNYGRVTVSAWDAAAGGVADNTNDITFNTPSGSWGLITHVIVADHGTNVTWGSNVNLLMYGTVTNQTPDDGDTVKFPAGDLNIGLS